MKTKTTYTKEQFQTAYTDWANSLRDSPVRANLWDTYCDMRDNLPLGTSYQTRITKEKQERLENNNRRILEQDFKERLQNEMEEKQFLKTRQKIEAEERKLYET